MVLNSSQWDQATYCGSQHDMLWLHSDLVVLSHQEHSVFDESSDYQIKHTCDSVVVSLSKIVGLCLFFLCLLDHILRIVKLHKIDHFHLDESWVHVHCLSEVLDAVIVEFLSHQFGHWDVGIH